MQSVGRHWPSNRRSFLRTQPNTNGKSTIAFPLSPNRRPPSRLTALHCLPRSKSAPSHRPERCILSLQPMCFMRWVNSGTKTDLCLQLSSRWFVKYITSKARANLIALPCLRRPIRNSTVRSVKCRRLLRSQSTWHLPRNIQPSGRLVIREGMGVWN